MRRMQRVICINTGEVFECSAAAALAAGVNKSTMSKHLAGKVRTIKNQIYVPYDGESEEPTAAELQVIRKQALNRIYGMMVLNGDFEEV